MTAKMQRKSSKEVQLKCPWKNTLTPYQIFVLLLKRIEKMMEVAYLTSVSLNPGNRKPNFSKVAKARMELRQY